MDRTRAAAHYRCMTYRLIAAKIASENAPLTTVIDRPFRTYEAAVATRDYLRGLGYRASVVSVRVG